jgi:hypothetical protein
MGLSVPVAFQYPDVAARFGRAPFGYLRSRGLKKYHSCSPKLAFADNQTMASKQANSHQCVVDIVCARARSVGFK